MRGTVAATVMLVAVLPGCGGSPATTSPPPPAAAVTVDIRNVAFQPRSVTVRSGQAVAWRFEDGSIPHDVTGADWRSPDQASGYYTHGFAGPGTYAYRCAIHSNMDGQVVVTP